MIHPSRGPKRSSCPTLGAKHGIAVSSDKHVISQSPAILVQNTSRHKSYGGPRLILSVRLRKITRPAAATSAEHRKDTTPIRTLLRHGGQDGATVEADEPQHSGHSRETLGQDRLRVVRAAREPQRIPLESGPGWELEAPPRYRRATRPLKERGVMLRRRGKTRDAGRLRQPCRAGKPRGSRLRSLGAPPCG